MVKTKPETKPTKVKTPKTVTAPKPREKKDGLRAAQTRILALLAKTKGVLNEWKIAEKAPVDKAWLPDSLFGRIGDLGEVKVINKATPDGLARAKVVGYSSLLALGFVKGRLIDNNGKMERVWEITATGRKALEKTQA